jgi:hypothetical protein
MMKIRINLPAKNKNAPGVGFEYPHHPPLPSHILTLERGVVF